MKALITTVFLAASLTAANAADLPRRTAAPAPVFVQNHSGFYAGVNGGVLNEDTAVGGATLGYRFNEFLRGELNGSGVFGDNHGQTVTADAVLGVPINRFTPYVLGGVGYGVNSLGKPNGDAAPLWTVGGGIRYGLTQNFELDGRYRYVRHFDVYNGGRLDYNQFTVGLNYKF